MAVVFPVNELQQLLKEAGQQLAVPPSSINDLLLLLDKTKQLLTFVGQTPSFSMQSALVPPMGALISDELIKHSEIDVRISVAACLCEVARITAPEIPYKDQIMKEIFQLNVLAFEQLSNLTGRSYYKVIHILQSIAKYKSCLLMLDLECDELVLEMFKQFLSKIRINHPDTVFSDIETIMTMSIEESDEISIELLYLLISHVKKENQIISPASWKIAEKVLRNCFITLKPYHETIRKLINSNFDNFAEVVTRICQAAYENEHMITRSTRTVTTHKRDLITLENGRSKKKQKYIDKNQFKGKEQRTSRRGRPKKNKNNLNQNNNSQEKSKTKKNSGSVNNGSNDKYISKKWGQDLVGHSIKVWWPLDEMYYKGVVSSYDPLDNKYKVLYADGDEELLDLSQEEWIMVDEFPPDQQQGKFTDIPSPLTPAKSQKQKGKRKLESLQTQEDNSNLPKSAPPADSSKTTNVICDVDNQKDSFVSPKSPPPADSAKTTDVICNVENHIDKSNSPKSPLPADSAKTTDVTCDVENHKDNSSSPKSPPPADSAKTTDVICHVDNQKDNSISPKRPLTADSAKTADVILDVDDQKDNLVQSPISSCGFKLTETTVDDVEKNSESYASGELQEKSLLNTNETTERLEKTDGLVSGT